MERKTFSDIRLHGLSNVNASGLFTGTIDIASSLRSSLGELAAAALTRFIDDNAAFKLQLNQSQKSALTGPLKDADINRDAIINDTKRKITFCMKDRDAAIKSEAAALKLFFEPYWHIDTAPFNTETDLIYDLLKKYNENAALKAKGVAIGIDAMMIELEPANTAFYELYKQRIAEKGDQKDTTSSSDLRPAVTQSYIDFCSAIEQTVNLMPSNAINTLFNQMDALRKTYHALIPPSKPQDGTTPSTGA
jgi:hypothetical protein